MILACCLVILSSVRDKRSFKNNLRNTLTRLKSDAVPLDQQIKQWLKVTITDKAQGKDLLVVPQILVLEITKDHSMETETASSKPQT
jgi:hypothetical protein